MVPTPGLRRCRWAVGAGVGAVPMSAHAHHSPGSAPLRGPRQGLAGRGHAAVSQPRHCDGSDEEHSSLCPAKSTSHNSHSHPLCQEANVKKTFLKEETQNVNNDGRTGLRRDGPSWQPGRGPSPAALQTGLHHRPGVQISTHGTLHSSLLPLEKHRTAGGGAQGLSADL